MIGWAPWFKSKRNCCFDIPVADPLFLDHNEARRTEKMFWRPPSSFSQGLDPALYLTRLFKVPCFSVISSRRALCGDECQNYLGGEGRFGRRCLPSPTAKNPDAHPLGTYETKMAGPPIPVNAPSRRSSEKIGYYEQSRMPHIKSSTHQRTDLIIDS